MDPTVWVAIAGIGGTLIGTVTSPLLAERMRRKSVRTEQLTGQQLEVYADLLNATSLLADNARDYSTMPLADLEEPDDDELNRLVSRARVVASKGVYRLLNKMQSQQAEFNRQLLLVARPYHDRLRREGKVDDSQAMALRMSLADVAGQIVESHKQIEATIRKEMGAD